MSRESMIEYLKQAETIDKRIRDKIIELLESEPPQGEFTKYIRDAFEETKKVGTPAFAWMSHNLLEACERIDRLEAENKELKKDREAGRKLWAEAQRARKQRALENDELRAELNRLEAQLKAKEQRIDRLENALLDLQDTATGGEIDVIEQALEGGE